MLFSLVIEFDDDTFVIQQEADTPDEAIEIGIKNSKEGAIRIFSKNDIFELIQEINEHKNSNRACTAISNLVNVWVEIYSVRDMLVQIHAIPTIKSI